MERKREKHNVTTSHRARARARALVDVGAVQARLTVGVTGTWNDKETQATARRHKLQAASPGKGATAWPGRLLPQDPS